MRFADFKCEANGCFAHVPAEVMRVDGEPTGKTRWCVPAKWCVRYVHEIAQEKRPEHERLVVLCPIAQRRRREVDSALTCPRVPRQCRGVTAAAETESKGL